MPSIVPNKAFKKRMPDKDLKPGWTNIAAVEHDPAPAVVKIFYHFLSCLLTCRQLKRQLAFELIYQPPPLFDIMPQQRDEFA